MSMQINALGHTGLQVSCIGLGCGLLGSSPTDYAINLVRRSFERGVTFYDVAPIYRDGETKLGLALEGLRDQVVVSTKTHAMSRDEAWRDLERSLERLRTDYVDNWHLHNVVSLEDLDRRMARGGPIEALLEAREQGVVCHIGCTGHRSANLIAAMDRFPCEIILVPMNLVEREPLEHLIPLCRERGVGVTIMKPMATGLLPGRLTLRWLLSQPVDSIVPGATTLDEALANAQVGHETAPLSAQELEQAEAEAAFWNHKRCRLCDACLPCPVGINLPSLLGTDVMFDHYRTMGPDGFRNYHWSRKAVEGDLPSRQRIVSAVEACTHCGACEERCPYELPITDMLADMLPIMHDMLKAYDQILDRDLAV